MNERPIPNTNDWIRKIVSASQGHHHLVLHDHRAHLNGSVTIDAATLVRADVAGWPNDPINFLTHLHAGSPSADDSSWRVVCHINTVRASFATSPDPLCPGVPLFPPAVTGQKVIALQVTTSDSLPDDPMVQHTHAGNDYVWLSMRSREAYKKLADWLPQFLDLSFEDAVKIANATDRAALDSDFQRRYAQLLDITHPGDPTARLAFRLLCEAWLMKNGQATTCEGIPITPPSNWLTPFKVGNITPDKAAIAAMMGKTLEAQATAVLDAVEQGDAAAISTAASAFVKACSQSLSTAGGAV